MNRRQKFTRKVAKIQQHHTYQPSYQQFNGSNHFVLMKGMEEYHVEGMGWSMISQQLTTFPDGKVAVGRPFNIAPEGSFGLQNIGGILILVKEYWMKVTDMQLKPVQALHFSVETLPRVLKIIFIP